MVYSNERFENKEFEFPPPPMWLTWMGEYDYYAKAQSGKGTVRHQESLAKAKDYVGRYNNNGAFYVDWAIYEWTGQRYELRYSGKRDEERRDHVLWSKSLTKGLPKRAATDEELEAAMQSILAAVGG